MGCNMGALLVIVGLVVALGLVALAGGGRNARRRPGPEGWANCDAADAEIEAVDVEQMLNALNERKRRAGRPQIGDELAKQLEPHLRDG